MARVGVVGTGAWGTTLAALLAQNGHDTYLLCRTRDEAKRLAADGENKRFRPGLRFPKTLFVVDHPAELLGTSLIVIAVPAHSLNQNLDAILPFVNQQTLLSATKGLEVESGRRVSEIVAAAGFDQTQICVLSGPNFSAEISAGKPAATVIAGQDAARTEEAQDLLTSERFRVYTSSDVTGVELGGALKNVVAIACGISDGLASGQNAKAALMTRALAEIARLGLVCGADMLTFLGLAGIGDLIATCESDLSRNRRLGLALASGVDLHAALARIDGVVEGVGTTRAVRVLAAARGVDMPIAEELYAVLFEGKPPVASMLDLMRRAPKQEFPL